MKNLKQTFGFLLGVALVLNFATMPLARAEISINQTLPSIETLKDSSFENCAVSLVPFYDYEVTQFLAFLDEHYRNKSSNSSLNNTAIARFIEFKQKLEEYLEMIQPDSQSGRDIFSEGSAFDKCEKVKNAYIEAAKEQFIRHVKANSATKKATIMLEKYRAINSRLNELSYDVSRTYSLFLKLQNKLPGFIRQCLMK